MAVIANPTLAAFALQNQNNLEALSHFIVDNNTTAVFAVLKANGYTFNTPGEASVIVRSLLTSTKPADISVVAQLGTIPYLNDATNGTGGVNGAIGVPTTLGAGDDLLCLGSKLFGSSIGCPTPGLTPDQQAAQAKAAADAAAATAKSQTITYFVIGAVIVAIIFFALYQSKQNKKSTSKT